MIEVSNMVPVNKGILFATCDVKIIPWKYTFLNVRVFQKGANRWIAMPAVEKDLNGEKKYYETGRWDNDNLKNRFRDQIMAAVDTFLQDNPHLRQEDAITEAQEVPF